MDAIAVFDCYQCFSSAGLFLAFGVTAISAVSITASDLPECAVECYCLTGAKVSIPVTDL